MAMALHIPTKVSSMQPPHILKLAKTYFPTCPVYGPWTPSRPIVPNTWCKAQSEKTLDWEVLVPAKEKGNMYFQFYSPGINISQIFVCISRVKRQGSSSILARHFIDLKWVFFLATSRIVIVVVFRTFISSHKRRGDWITTLGSARWSTKTSPGTFSALPNLKLPTIHSS